jgi:enoyl-[acyl-carrier protein] reductase II
MKTLEQLWEKGTKFLGCKHAILCGAMSWVSEHNLVAAISNSGAFGVIACGSMPPALLQPEIQKTKAKTKNNFGVNLITMHPQLDELIDVCIAEKVSHVVLAGGLPKSVHIKKLKDAGIKVLCFAPAIALAKKLVRDGADALIIEGSEAGGHIGPVSTSVLAQEILPFMRENNPDVPVFVAGGIGNGEAIVSYLKMGASGCQLGTKFVCAEESIAHENFKKSFIKSQARDALPSVQIFEELPVIPVRAIVNKGSKEFEKCQREVHAELMAGKLSKEEAQLKVEHFWAGALKRAVIDGDVESGSVMAGQSVGMVTSIQPTQAIVDDLIAQANVFLAV